MVTGECGDFWRGCDFQMCAVTFGDVVTFGEVMVCGDVVTFGEVMVCGDFVTFGGVLTL